MFNYDRAISPWTGNGLEWALASSAVEQAIGDLEEAGAALVPLIHESQWQAAGVRSLHQLILEMKTRTAAEIGELGTRLWEITLMAAS